MHLRFPLLNEFPVLSVRLWVPSFVRGFAEDHGARVPDPISAQALLSTGHDASFITRACAERLPLPRTGMVECGGPAVSGPPRPFETARVRVLIVGDDGHEAFAEPKVLIVDGPLASGVDILLGLDFLRNFVLAYNGWVGLATLDWKFSGPAPGHG